MVIVKCNSCGKCFYKKPSEININNTNFCSQKCYGKYISKTRTKNNNPRWNSVEIICDVCDKPFFVQPSTISRKRGGYKYCSNVCKSIAYSKKYNGSNNNAWNDGITPLYTQIRNNPKMDEWKQAVFKRDNYCDWFSGCKSSRNNKLEAHHIFHFAKLLVKYNIKTLEDALNCKPLWDINNGVTMLKSTHQAYHNMYGKDYE